MQSTCFSTYPLPSTDQFPEWRGYFRSLADTVPVADARHGFPARCESWHVGGLTIFRGSAPAVQTTRSKAHIRRNPVDHWCITVYLRGTATYHTWESSISMPPGAAFVFSLAYPMTTVKDDYERIQLFLSRDAFASVARLLDGVRGVHLAAADSRLLADYMAFLASHMTELSPENGLRLVTAVEAMITACLAPTPDRLASVREQIHLTLMERIRRTVRRHLRSPILTPAQLCREAATSRSQLYRVLEREGGVARYIQRERLAESLVMLSDASCSSTISQISESFCFSDASSFSRAFRREFGMSPSDARAATAAGLSFPVRPGSETSRNNEFADCLTLR